MPIQPFLLVTAQKVCDHTICYINMKTLAVIAMALALSFTVQAGETCGKCKKDKATSDKSKQKTTQKASSHMTGTKIANNDTLSKIVLADDQFKFAGVDILQSSIGRVPSAYVGRGR